MYDLTVIQKDLDSIDSHIIKLIGANKGPLIIQDNQQKLACQDNLVIVKKIIKQLEESRVEAVTPLNDLVDQTNKSWNIWKEAFKKRQVLLEKGILDFNNIERKAEDEKRLADASAVNVDVKVDQLPTTIVKSKTESSTMTESETIEEFQINNHTKAALWCIANGMSGSLKLDKTTETAIKKALVNNPDIKLDEEMGFYFKRGMKLNTRARQ